jgi:hypothetical protein
MDLDMPAGQEVRAPIDRRENKGRVHRLNCEALEATRPGGIREMK